MNKSLNASTRLPSQEWPLPHQLEHFLYTLHVSVFVTGVVGNSFIIYSLGFRQQKLKRGDGLIISLAITDLFASIVTPWFMIQQLIFRREWKFGFAACKLVIGFVMAPVLASAWLLVMIAVERFRAIAKPFDKKWTPRTILIITIIIYVLSTIAVTPRIYHQRYWPPVKMCSDFYKRPETMTIVRLSYQILVFVVPLFVLVALYGIGIYRLSERQRKSSLNGKNIRERQITKMCVCIILVFFVLALPQTVTSSMAAIMMPFYGKLFQKHSVAYARLAAISPAILTANSCVNPFIYAKMHREVKKHIKSIWNTASDKCLGPCGRCYAHGSIKIQTNAISVSGESD